MALPKEERNKFTPQGDSEISLTFETGPGEMVQIKRMWNGT